MHTAAANARKVLPAASTQQTAKTRGQMRSLRTLRTLRWMKAWHPPTSADASVPSVDIEVAVQLSVVVTDVPVITQITLLAWTNTTTVTAVLDCSRRLAAWRVLRTLARVPTCFRPLLLHSGHSYC